MRTMYVPGSSIGIRYTPSASVTDSPTTLPALILGHDAHVGHRLGDPLAIFVLGTVLHAPGDRLSGLVVLGVSLPDAEQAAERRASNDDSQCGQDAP